MQGDVETMVQSDCRDCSYGRKLRQKGLNGRVCHNDSVILSFLNSDSQLGFWSTQFQL